MGCFHSIPSRVQIAEPIKSHEDNQIQGNESGESHMVPIFELHEVSENAGDIEINECFVNDIVEKIESDSEGILSVSVTSPDRGVRSDIAEDTTSRSGDSVDALGDTETPDPIVSPNPVSPSHGDNFVHIMDGKDINQSRSRGLEIPVVTSTPPGSIRFSSSPLPAYSASPNIALKPSRLIELSALRDSRLCLQVFGVWRSDVLKTKVETLQLNLDMAGKASEIILTENYQLKAKLEELENHLRSLSLQSSPAGKPMEAIAVQTDTLAEVPTTPQKVFHDVSNFITPPSVRSQLLESTFITPPEEPRRNWESVASINPSSNPPLQTRSSPIRLSVSPSPQSEKFRQLSNDIAKLTESIGKFELKKTTSSKTPITSAVTPMKSYTYTP